MARPACPLAPLAASSPPWLLPGLAVAPVLLALLILAVGPQGGRDTREIALPADGVVAPGGSITLPLPGSLRTSHAYRLTVRCTGSETCTRLRVGAGPDAPGRPPGGFSSQVFLDVVRKASLAQTFEGFTFFANARANMLDTLESMPSFMTGTFFPPKPPGMTDAQWWADVVGEWRGRCSREGILEHAYRQGYTITQYVPRLKWCPHDRTTEFRVGTDLQARASSLAAFADLWLFRITPAPWKASIFGRGNRGVLESLLRQPGDIEWGYWSVGHMAQLVEDEAERPPRGRYVWAHFGIPHPPSVVDADCRYVGARWHRDPAGGYEGQATCALRLAGRLVAALERAGRFDTATIVVHSDHAMN